MSIKSDQIADALIHDLNRALPRWANAYPLERDLVIRFDANRGAVREAMAKVAQLGLADVLPGGARVRGRELASLDVIGYLLAQQELPDPSLVDQILVVINNGFGGGHPSTGKCLLRNYQIDSRFVDAR